MPAPRLHEIKAEYTDEWLDVDGVEGVGVGASSIIIDISKPREDIEIDLPDTDVTIEFQESGAFVAEPATTEGEIDAEPQRASYYRPVIGGVSIGHPNVTAGTSGFVARDPDTGDRYVLSNNHVIANTNNSSLGDPTLQPAAMHNGPQVGELAGYIEIERGVTVDVAWSRITHSDGLEPTLLGIEDPDEPVSVRSPDPGDGLQKSGITTGVTTGEVEQIDASINVRFSNGETVRFDQCIFASRMSDAGDSGSGVIDADGNPVGLVFAGSDRYTIICAADNIEEETGLEIVYGPQEDDEEDISPNARVEVTVFDGDDEPLSGASVTAETDDIEEKTTDSRGKVYFSTDIEPVELSIDAEGFESERVTLDEEDFD